MYATNAHVYGKLTSVEFSGELDLSLNLLVIVHEGIFGELDAQFVLTSLLCLILVLHVRVHVSVEEPCAILVFERESYSLVRDTTLLDELIIGLHECL